MKTAEEQVVEDVIDQEFMPDRDKDAVFFISYYYEIHGFVPSC